MRITCFFNPENYYSYYQKNTVMKHLGTFLSIISIVVGITSCEESPEERFDLSSIPGQYEGRTEIWVPSDTSYGRTNWSLFRIIPEWNPPSPCCQTHKIEIQKGKKNQFTLTFEPIDTLLPNEITVEKTGFHEYSWDEIQADIKVTENNLFKDTALISNAAGYFNWFRYSESEVFPTITFNLYLKSKSLDNIILGCSGIRYYD
jgi:hypothetical protein